LKTAACLSALSPQSALWPIEQSKSSKADLVAALKEACAYCDKAYDSMTDASATEVVKSMGHDMPKLGVLTVNVVHTVEHYGNLVTYLRMKNIVPPTSDPEFMKQEEPLPRLPPLSCRGCPESGGVEKGRRPERPMLSAFQAFDLSQHVAVCGSVR